MGQKNSTARKVIIINPNSPETNEEYIFSEKKNEKDQKSILVEELKKSFNTKLDISKIDDSLEKRNDFFINRIKNNSGLKSEMTFERDEFYSKCQNLESYFCLKIDEAREFEEPCKKMRTTMTECLRLNIENPLSCTIEVSNFISCLNKSKQ